MRNLACSGTHWAVSTPHHAASDAAAAVFASGGNAVDAALAAAAMLTVVYPNQVSLGGDLIALVGTPDGRVHVVNASGRAPAAVDVEAVAGGHTSMPVDGPLPVTVPGVVSGWAALCDRWGSRPLSDALTGAEAAARGGVPVAPGLARAITEERDRIGADPGLRAVFSPGGRPLRTGATLRQPALADSLALLCADGPDALYRGTIGARIVTALRSLGSAMTTDDLAKHRVEFGACLRAELAGLEYLTAGANSQGVCLLEGLRALDVLRERGTDLDPLGAGAGRVAAVLAAAAADRDSYIGDGAEAARTAEFLLSDEHIAELLARDPAAQNPVAASAGVADPAIPDPAVPDPATSVPVPHGDTTAVTTVDRDGLWVSLLQSVFHTFGAGILEPRTGIVLQNRGASFSLRPGAPNRLAGGKRPLHTLMPVIVRRGGQIVGARAVMGGRAQPQIQTHLALALDAGANAAGAVSRPRWTLGTMDAGGAAVLVPRAYLEADVPDDAAQAIAAAGFAVERIGHHDDDAGHAHLVRVALGGVGDGDADGASNGGEPPDPSVRRFEAAADPRSDGAALAG